MAKKRGMSGGHLERRVTVNPSTGVRYYRDVFVKDIPAEELSAGPPAVFPEGSTRERPVGTILTVRGEREAFVPPTFAAKVAEALEEKE